MAAIKLAAEQYVSIDVSQFLSRSVISQKLEVTLNCHHFVDHAK